MGEDVGSAVTPNLARVDFSSKKPPIGKGHKDPRAAHFDSALQNDGSGLGTLVLLTTIEGLVIVLASIASGIGYHEIFLEIGGQRGSFLGIGLLAAALYCSVMGPLDRTKRLRRPNGLDAFRDVAVVWVCVILFITFIAFLLKFSEQLSRGATVVFLVAGAASLGVVRALSPRIAEWNRSLLETNTNRVLLIGAYGHEAVDDLVREIASAGFRQPKIIQVNPGCREGEWDSELRRALDEIMQIARASGPGDICISSAGFSETRMNELVASLRVVPRAIQLVPDVAIQELLGLPSRSIGRLRSVELQRAPLNARQIFLKRLLDLSLAIPILVFISPLLLAIAALIKWDSPGPVLFRQLRRGLHGRPFEILKFRTMTIESEADIRQATRNDGRVTSIGRWLRKTSLDELPQLLNVVDGQMSLVGPRPHALTHDEYYSRLIKNYEVRQHVLPGITGWAQVNGLRGETPELELMVQRVDHDIWYAVNANLVLDLKILARTTVEVLRSRNAY